MILVLRPPLMYVDDERFKKNIDKYGEETTEFAAEGIKIYVEKK